VLQRRDRLAQAISFARASQTGAWRSTVQEKRDPGYSFDAICRSYFFVQRSYDFWETYLGLRSLDASKFYYEDMIDDYAPYMDAVRDHAGIGAEASDTSPESKLSIQRDALNDEWRTQFTEDLKVKNLLTGSLPRPPVLPGSNLVNFLRQRPTKPKPFVW
jgi:LPS sulfotransferase NodH